MQAQRNCCKAAQAIFCMRQEHYLSSTLKRMSQGSQNHEMKNTPALHNQRGYKVFSYGNWDSRITRIQMMGLWKLQASYCLGKPEASQLGLK